MGLSLIYIKQLLNLQCLLSHVFEDLIFFLPVAEEKSFLQLGKVSTAIVTRRFWLKRRDSQSFKNVVPLV